MIALMVTVYDRQTGTHSMPMFVATRGSALRAFQDDVNRAANDNPVYRHPEDYQMYVIGEYNDASGEVKGMEPELLARAVDLVVSKS